MTVVQPALAPPRIVSERRARRQPDPALGDGARALRGQPRACSCGAGRARRRTACSWPSATGDGDWVNLTWGEANRKANAVAQALLDRGLGPEAAAADPAPGNAIDHALLTLGGFLAGVPVVPVSPAYSLMSQDYGKVKHIAALVKPGLVYAADAGPFGGVLSAVDFGGAEIVLSKGTGATRVRRAAGHARRPRRSTRR